MTLYVLEKPWVNLLVWIGAAVVNVSLNFVLIPIDWRLGAALPVSLAVILMPVVYWVILERRGFRRAEILLGEPKRSQQTNWSPRALVRTSSWSRHSASGRSTLRPVTRCSPQHERSSREAGWPMP